MDEAEVAARLDAALSRLRDLDLHLLSVDASERSMTHRLAVHLIEQFPCYDIDCEYNRDGFDVKRLQLSEPPVPVGDDALDAVTVFPDIVVHRRGHNEDNLLVIEVKKRSSTIGPAYDLKKLRAFKSELKYRHAVHLTIGLDGDGQPLVAKHWMPDTGAMV